MKPVESYSAINARMDRPNLNEVAANKAGPLADAAKPAAVSTTAATLAAGQPPFDAQKVADLREQIAAGTYHVDTDALADKMLTAGVFGLDTET